MQTIWVKTKTSEYPVYIGKELFNDPALLHSSLKSRQVMIITDSSVAPLYLDKILALLTDYQCDSYILPEGEENKTLASFERIIDRLIVKGHQRSTTLIALGGGVVGDITGFAAACYQRGVNWIQIPTTVLAQVDAAVGGKTAVNHGQVKNILGAFYPPQCVIADLSFLHTLPERMYLAGIAEVVKYGLIADAEFYAWLQENKETIRQRQPAALAQIVKRSVEIKAEIVTVDEYDQGIRAILNFGHTFAHALEKLTGFNQLLHGEAVAIGMIAAIEVSCCLGWIENTESVRLQKLLQYFQLPVFPPQNITIEDWLRAIRYDKKIMHDQLQLILLQKIGKAIIHKDMAEQQLYPILAGYSKRREI